MITKLNDNITIKNDGSSNLLSENEDTRKCYLFTNL